MMLMNGVSIKKVALWGFLIVLADQVLGSVLLALLGKGNFILIGSVLALAVSIGLAYKSAKSLTEGLLEEVVAGGLALLLGMLGGQNNYIIILLFVVGGLVGGLLASKK